MSNNRDFQTYLQSVRSYTIKDIVGQPLPPQEKLPQIMVKTLPQWQRESNLSPEKTERLTILEGLRKYASDHVLLIGRSGSGKSIALNLLWQEQARRALNRESDKIPVLVKLSYYKISVLNLVKMSLKEHNLQLDEFSLEQLLNEGRFLLLMDGINELPDSKAQKDLQKFHDDYPQTPMIFTTRDWRASLDISQKIEILPLTEKQMLDFVQAYQGPGSAKIMKNTLGDRLRELGQTPLLLCMLCWVFKETDGKPPNSLGGLLRQFTERYYQRAFKNEVPVDENCRRVWSLLLQELAFKMIDWDKSTELRLAISRKETERILTICLENMELDQAHLLALKWIDNLLDHHLIQTNTNGDIEFCHQLIQEYYAAERLLEKLSDLSDKYDEWLKWTYLNCLKWTEPLAIMQALVEKETQALRVIKLAIEVDIKLGAKLAGSLTKFHQPAFELINGLEVPQRIKIWLLGITGFSEGVPIIAPAFKDEDHGLRGEAREALIKIGSVSAIHILFKALEHPEDDVRSQAAWGLWNIGSEAAISALRFALQEKSEIRFLAAWALGHLGYEDVISELVSALANQDYVKCVRAASAIPEIPGEKIISHLVNALKHDNDTVRYHAIFALEKIGKAAIPHLVTVLEGEERRDWLLVVFSLGNIGSEEAISYLVKVLEYQGIDDIGIRNNTVVALGDIGSEKAIPCLVKALEYINPYDIFDIVRGSTIKALKKIGTEEAISALRKALHHKDDTVRCFAKEALKDIDDPYGFLNETKNSTDKAPNVPEHIASAMTQINSSHCDLFQRYEDHSLYWEVCRALTVSGSPELLEPLSKFLLTTKFPIVNGHYDLRDVIAAIQKQCGYYNYCLTTSVAPTSPQKDNFPENAKIEVRKLTIKAPVGTIGSIMSKTVSFLGSVGIVNTDKVEIGPGGKQVGIENLNPEPETSAQAEAEIKELLEQLDFNYSSATEPESEPTLDKNRGVATNLARIIQAGGIEGVKVMFPLLSIPIEMIKKWYQILEERYKNAIRGNNEEL